MFNIYISIFPKNFIFKSRLLLPLKFYIYSIYVYKLMNNLFIQVIEYSIHITVLWMNIFISLTSLDGSVHIVGNRRVFLNEYTDFTGLLRGGTPGHHIRRVECRLYIHMLSCVTQGYGPVNGHESVHRLRWHWWLWILTYCSVTLQNLTRRVITN